MRIYTAKKLLDEKYLLGESPCYDADTGNLSWVDIKTGTFHVLNDDGKYFSMQTGQYLGAAVPVEYQNKYLGVMTTGLYWIEKDRLEKAYDLSKDFLVGQRANDGKCDPEGRFWFGSMPLFSSVMQEGGDIYCFGNDGKCEKKIISTKVPNGMAWSEEKNLFYFIDSGMKTLFACDYDKKEGKIGNRRVIREFSEGIPDGMTIDTDGMLWIALWGGGCIGRFHPESGEMIARVEVPAIQVSSCCFGGPKSDILYITSSSEGRSGKEDGCIFSCRLDIEGVKNHKYRIGK